MALLLCALPAVAAATTFEVNTTKDGEELQAECGPGGDETCLTLREAIEQSNFNDSPEADTITFGALPVGQRQIVVEGESLPAITREVTVDGNTAPGTSGGAPGVEIVAGDLGESGFTTGLKVHEGTGTRIEGFAIGGFEAGIEVGPAESEESDESPTDTQICGNYLGVKLDGTTTEPNVTGVEVWSPSEPERPKTTQIGGAGCAGNAISGNSSYGVLDDGLDTTIAGNRIGFGPEPGDLEMPNGTEAGEGGAAGIRVEPFASGGMIGGTVPGGNEGNLIWFNDGPGVWVEGSAGEVSIRQDSFMGNQGLGIEIVGGTPPAPPVVSAAAEPARQSFKVEGTVTGTVGESVELEFFGSPTCDPSGSGEGQTYLGSAVQPIEAEPTHYEFILPTEPPADDTVITATQTREAGATSEFSECAPYVAPQTLTVTTTEDAFHGECTVTVCSLRDAIEAANATPSVDTIDFGVAGRIEDQFTSLPAITAPVEIDGTSAPGYDGTPLVEIDGAAVTGSGTTGLVVRPAAGGSTIAALAIGHFDDGVLLEGTDNQVCGSYLGVATNGTTQLADEIGIETAPGSAGDRIGAGCTALGGGNLISANTAVGIDDRGSETRIADNRIGINANGEPMGNGEFGTGAGIAISPESSRAMIGRIDGETGNVIAHNQDPGIVVAHSASVAKIRGNSIFENFGQGIEIEIEAPIVPTVTGVTVGSGTLTFSGEATAGPGEEAIDLDFFAGHTCDPSGAGEGQTFLGSESVESVGGATAYETEGLTATLPAGQNYITATSTGTVLGQTTEFSQCFLYVPPPQTFIVTTINDSFDGECTVALCSLRDAIEAADESPNHDTIDFGVTGTIKPQEGDLPALTEPVTIDGTSAPGYAGAPLVEIDGTEALNEGPTEGLRIEEGSTIERLAITNFEEGVVVDANHSVLDRDTVAHNQELGIFVSSDAPATSIRRSEIFDDGGSPIEFETPNDVPSPILESFVAGPTATTYTVPVAGPANETYALDIFANAQCEASDFGPAEVLLASGEVTIGADGEATAELHGGALTGIDAESFTVSATEEDTGTTSQLGHCARTQPGTTIESTPAAVSPASKATFTFSGHSTGQIASYECSLDAGAFEPCTSPQEYTGLEDGSHTFRTRAVSNEGAKDPEPPSYTWKVEANGPTSSITAAPPATTEATTASFEFGAPGATGYECSLDSGGFAPCTSPRTFSALAPGAHSFAVRATGEAGSTGRPATYQWTVSNPPEKAQASTSPPPAEEGPTPTNGEKVVVQPEEGKVLIKLPGSKKFVPLEELKEIPVGAVIDATKGKVRLTSIDPDGTEQSANFFGGVFKVKQREGAGLVVLELLDTTACPAPRSGGKPRLALASSLAARPGSGSAGKLWGSGHGNFRTEGNNGSATVRGTIWLVEDRCNGTTFFRTRRGIVSVRDFTTGKTLPLPAGKTYVAGEG